ncbi:hypothetical protein TNCV_2478421 [Trichonephila clavipes]|nr:hypothetical protein TNCV_2478421 [Trichonephila clavipes]
MPGMQCSPGFIGAFALLYRALEKLYLGEYGDGFLILREFEKSRNVTACTAEIKSEDVISSDSILCSQRPSFLAIVDDCQVIYSQFGLAIHQNDHQARRTFVEWTQNEIAVVPDFHKRILFRDEAHFWLNGYVNKQNCRIWSEANPQVYVETPLHPEKLTVWCALWAGGILLQKR